MFDTKFTALFDEMPIQRLNRIFAAFQKIPSILKLPGSQLQEH